jgi:hypothetical protein
MSGSTITTSPATVTTTTHTVNQSNSNGLVVYKGCPIRLRELNTARKRGPTSLQGGAISNGNAIRRRVAHVTYKKDGVDTRKPSYGPLFGFKKNPHLGGKCADKALHSANSGNSSDVIYWKKLYGGPRPLFSTASCDYGCCGDKLFNKDNTCERTSEANRS